MKIRVRLAFGHDYSKIEDFCQTSDSFFYKEHPFCMPQPMSLTYCRFWLTDCLRKTRNLKELYTRLYVYTYDGTVLINSTLICCRCNRSITTLYKKVADFSRYSFDYILPY